jgi:putative SOS response-associated peptidase YedK
MCNLYTWKMTAEQMRALKLHYQFIGTPRTEWEERQRRQNEPIEDVYPNKRAPVAVLQNGEHVVREDMLWGFPKYKPVASLARSRAPLRRAGDGLRGARQDHAQGRYDVAVVQAHRRATVLLRRDLAAGRRPMSGNTRSIRS